MRKISAGVSLAALITGLGVTVPLTSGAATAAPDSSKPTSSQAKNAKTATSGKKAMKANEPQPDAPSDALPNPIADKQVELRQQAVADVIKGEEQPQTINGSQVAKVGKEAAPVATDGSRIAAAAEPVQDQYVELANEGTDKVFVLLVEFGTRRSPDYPDVDVNPATPGPVKFDGPAFNEIPKPGANDNSTGWRPNYNRKYYRDLYFGEGEGVESLKSFYERQSSGRYSVDGDVTAVTRVPFNEARYGRPYVGVRDGGPACSLDDIVCSNTWALLEDGMTQWVRDQRALGKTAAQIKKQLAAYDKSDRYDFDGDGDFNEPDGYIDRFQIIHAGGDEADGDPIYGEDAIWSHRWYARYTDEGKTGPANNKLGGIQIGNTGIWAGDYTIQPENGGISVVAHEYGHDLGLPDHYDTAASGDNPVSWWTLMAQSRVSDTGDQGLGTRAADLGVWDKLQLGWLDYETVVAGQDKTLELGPHEYNSAKAQGVAVVLPDKTKTTTLPTPAAGTKQWWSGGGDDYDATMSRTIAVPAAGGTLSLSAAWNIEEDYDYAYLEVQPAGSTTWTALPTTSLDADTGAGADTGIDGLSATYKRATFDLAPYAGTTIGFRVRYSTDGAVQGQDPSLGWSGILVDDISVVSGSTTVFTDGAETPPNGWTLDGFSSVGASITTGTDQFYLASNRTYTSFDKYLQTGPYNFGDPSRPDFAEKFPYQNGLLVNYWDTSFTDNNTSQHPGQGLVLPVDANPELKYNLEGAAWRGRIQTYDAPFGLEKSDSFNLTVNGKKSYVRGSAAQPLFDDTDVNRYFAPQAAGGQPRTGVKVAGAGVQMQVLNQSGTSMTVRIY